MEGVGKMKNFQLLGTSQVKELFNFNDFKKDLGDSLFRSVKKFAYEEVEPVTRKDTGTLRDSMDVLQVDELETIIYFDDNKCNYALEAHELPDYYKTTTEGTMSKFLERPIYQKGNEIFETVEQVMRVKGWK